MKQQFEIDNFTTDVGKIKVFATSSSIENLDFEIDKANFDKWLKENDRLKWEEDTVNHLGEHEQKTGEIDADIYWLLQDMEMIKSDMYDYIVETT